MARKPTTIWTIGHSTRSIAEFIALLQENQIEAVADVRSFPGSRRYPHFGKEKLYHSLEQSGINYFHFPELGGRRRAKPDSANTAWRNAAFRGYADYMESAEFDAGIERLKELGRSERTAILCAEALWWRCHRSLIADFFKANGTEVIHIMAPRKTEVHSFTSPARIVEGKLSYSH